MERGDLGTWLLGFMGAGDNEDNEERGPVFLGCLGSGGRANLKCDEFTFKSCSSRSFC